MLPFFMDNINPCGRSTKPNDKTLKKKMEKKISKKQTKNAKNIAKKFFFFWNRAKN